MNVVILTFSGLPSFDYALPLINKVRKETELDKVYLLSNSLNYLNLFPNFEDSKEVLKRMKIINNDLSNNTLLKYIKFIFKFNERSHNKPYFILKLINSIEKKIIKRFNLTIKALDNLKPDIVFFDHRNPHSVQSYVEIFKYLNKNGIKTYLLPHAPHYLNESEHLSTGLPKELLTNVSYIEPFEYSNVAPNFTDDYFSVENIGYPGFEDDWIKLIKEHPVYTNSLILLLRPFHTKDSKWNKNEKVVLLPEELDEIIYSVNLLIKNNKYQKVIIKPHPKNYQADLDKFITPTINHEKIIYYHDSVINLISLSNTFVSTYSTTLLTTIASSCKTYIINTQIFDRVFEEWNVLKNLYSNFTGFTTPDTVLNVEVNTKLDKIHLAQYFKASTNEHFKIKF